MIEATVITLWIFFAVYATWYFTSAKHYAPLTASDARILWKIHKQTAKCSSRRWREIRRGRKIVGFACECGYKYMQKRPIATSTPQQTTTQSPTVIYQKLHRA
ncbi:hypothetical protein KEJ37_03875 [Candidatus Bathyarchaeota archaeon]|nr:hypothetical protein [Candidatus Bathyarchaeota archaeon]